ncbi:DUF1659 domain-containing protein [[Eubacterium] rectale]|uniref:DUF1659 domain-containing protein n=1 Tax=Agathobacter rectalis TaxID=39491 RepID=A0AAW4UTC0_9FIRM|nr:DUF1659 domain-containing protein [Agathobacter rectalis]
MNENGKPVTKAKSFANVAVSATPDAIRQFAEAYASLQQKALVRVTRTDLNDISA